MHDSFRIARSFVVDIVEVFVVDRIHIELAIVVGPRTQERQGTGQKLQGLDMVDHRAEEVPQREELVPQKIAACRQQTLVEMDQASLRIQAYWGMKKRRQRCCGNPAGHPPKQQNDFHSQERETRIAQKFHVRSNDRFGGDPSFQLR